MQAFIFDLDGTLLNTLADIATACNTILGRHNYPQHPLDAYMQMVGNGFDKLIRRALPPVRMPSACEIEAIIQEARAYYAANMMDRTQPYPGISAALIQLQKAGRKLAMLSNKPDAMSKALVSHYFTEINFEKVQGAIPGLPLKPNPETLLSMLADMRVNPDAACYIGDSNVDIETAKNAAVMSIGVAWGFRGSEELHQAGADLVLDKAEQLLSLTKPT